MYEYKCKIVKIIDGDTVDVDIDLGFGVWLHKERIRLYGIDTPESRTRDLEEKKYGLKAKEMVETFKFIGESYEVENEDQIDLHTVLIGSGPAFFYDLMQEFEKRLDELLTDKESKRLVSIVFLSSIINAIKNGENLEELVESVASKGGTTEAALQKLDEKVW